MTRKFPVPSSWLGVSRPTGLLLLAVVIGGCAPAPKAPEAPQKAPSLAMDPCAEQLHEIAGMMLQYYAAQRRLPATLEELKAVDPGAEAARFVCPETGKPYVYDPKGIEVPGGAGEVYGRLVLYDAEAGHRGMRWGIAVVEQGSGRPLVTRIIAAPGDGTQGEKSPSK